MKFCVVGTFLNLPTYKQHNIKSSIISITCFYLFTICFYKFTSSFQPFLHVYQLFIPVSTRLLVIFNPFRSFTNRFTCSCLRPQTCQFCYKTLSFKIFKQFCNIFIKFFCNYLAFSLVFSKQSFALEIFCFKDLRALLEIFYFHGSMVDALRKLQFLELNGKLEIQLAIDLLPIRNFLMFTRLLNPLGYTLKYI